MVIIYLPEEAVVRENWNNIEHTLHVVFWFILTTHIPQVSLAEGRKAGVGVEEGER